MPYLTHNQPRMSPAHGRKHPAPMQPADNPNTRAASILTGKSVVVVEDEGITQMQLRLTLKNAGLKVVASATSGQSGVEAVLSERPDLVLMDIVMPGSYDGLEAARRILSVYPACILMLTALSDEECRKQAKDINVAGYIVKPVTAESLLPKIENALRRRLTQ